MLAKADARPGVEGEEDERVRDEVLLHALVDEPFGIKREPESAVSRTSRLYHRLMVRRRGTYHPAPEILPAAHEQHGVETPGVRWDVKVRLAWYGVLPCHGLDRAPSGAHIVSPVTIYQNCGIVLTAGQVVCT